MSEERDIIDALGSVGETLMYRGFEYEAGTTSEAASEITRLRGEAEAREVEIAALVESAREAQQLYVQADNEAQRLRGEVERTLTVLNGSEWELARQFYAAMLSSAPKPKEG